MTRIDALRPWLVNPSVPAGWATFWTAMAVTVPALIRSSVDGAVSGCESVPFVPAVLLTAIFLGWRYATVVALASAFLADALFMGHGRLLLEGPCDYFGVSAFLISSTLIIGTVELIRSEIGRASNGGSASESSAGIVFSLESGQAWASWYGSDAPIRLGPQKEVAEMMKDFLAQLELAKRLGSEPSAR